MSVDIHSQEGVRETESLYSNSIPLSLRQQPLSVEAVEFVRRVASEISDRRKPLRNHVKIVGAVIGDLLRGQSFVPAHSCYRAVSNPSFTRFHYGYKPFVAVRDNLVKGGYLRFVRGQQPFDDVPGVVSRFHATDKLMLALAAAGITPANFTKHFAVRTDIPLVHDPVRLKTASTRRYGPKVDGKPMTVKRTSKVVRLEEEVHQINDFLCHQSFEGMTFDGLFRGFNEGVRDGYGWDKGGRLYAVGGGFQALDKYEKRPLIRINGEETVEVDICASHLTIFHALMKATLPGSGDPYATGEIGRDGIKLFSAITLGNGSIPSRWSSKASENYLKAYNKRIKLGLPVPGMTGDLRKDYPFQQVRDIAIQHIPLLKAVEGSGYTWADFQFIESQILIESIKTLIGEGVATLPLHDSLIAKRRDSNRVAEVISDRFNEALKVRCYTKIK
ncbi:hypothetical protein EDF58_1011479 [Novosphingobium sp. PhB57]|uniref:hypothetical protein n=1 Tax=Novosphingobium sp. PhB57 TaxID=2485107 RepID=UPI001050B100|nr:hypothetical protein [Novosphingobium sp. PhB57]TCU62145.1 hypothetical protein EDF58_1011479 [Novosphingobium sp. PhB57]